MSEAFFPATCRDADEVVGEPWSDTCSCKAVLSALGLVSLIEASVLADRVWVRPMEVSCHCRVCDVVRLLWFCGFSVISYSLIHTLTHTPSLLLSNLFPPSRNVLDAFGVWFCISVSGGSIFSIPCVKQADVWRFPFQTRESSPE